MAFRPVKIAAIIAWPLLVGCHTTVPIQVPVPPEIDLDVPMGHIIVINRLDPSLLSFDNENKTEIYEIALEKFVEGLQEGFQSHSNFSITVEPTRVFVSENPREEAGPLPPGEVVKILNPYQADFLLAMDKVDIGFSRETEKDDEGNKTMHSNLIMNMTTTFYGQEGNIIQRVWDQRETYYESRDVESGLLAVGPSLGKADESVKGLAHSIGLDYRTKFYPTAETHYRKLFTDKEFGDVYRAVNFKQWEKAEGLLLRWVEEEDKQLAGHAAFDLGVIHELQGQPDAAKEWYEKARKLLGAKFPDL